MCCSVLWCLVIWCVLLLCVVFLCSRSSAHTLSTSLLLSHSHSTHPQPTLPHALTTVYPPHHPPARQLHLSTAPNRALHSSFVHPTCQIARVSPYSHSNIVKSVL